MIEDDFDFWGGAEEATGEFESKGGSFEVLPDGTRCLAIIDSIEWDSFPCEEGEAIKFIKARWSIMQPADYENRKIFHNIKLYGDDPSGKFYDPEKQQAKREKERATFWAIDKNCGGKIAAKGRHEITNEELQRCLINKPMYITLGVWETPDKTKSGNWIRKIEPSSAGAAAATPKPKQATKPITRAQPVDDDDDIPF